MAIAGGYAEWGLMDNTEAQSHNENTLHWAERRRAKRRQVLKHAQLIFGTTGSTIDCLVLDESAFGVQAETAVMTRFPDRLRIRFASGETYDAERQWSTGNRLGLHFVGSQIYDDETERQRKAIRLVLKTQGFHAAVLMLQDVTFFRNEDIRVAVKATELALERLYTLLD